MKYIAWIPIAVWLFFLVFIPEPSHQLVIEHLFYASSVTVVMLISFGMTTIMLIYCIYHLRIYNHRRKLYFATIIVCLVFWGLGHLQQFFIFITGNELLFEKWQYEYVILHLIQWLISFGFLTRKDKAELYAKSQLETLT